MDPLKQYYCGETVYKHHTIKFYNLRPDCYFACTAIRGVGRVCVSGDSLTEVSLDVHERIDSSLVTRG